MVVKSGLKNTSYSFAFIKLNYLLTTYKDHPQLSKQAAFKMNRCVFQNAGTKYLNKKQCN